MSAGGLRIPRPPRPAWAEASGRYQALLWARHNGDKPPIVDWRPPRPPSQRLARGLRRLSALVFGSPRA